MRVIEPHMLSRNQKRRKSSKKWLFVAAILIVGAVGVFGFMKRGSVPIVSNMQSNGNDIVDLHPEVPVDAPLRFFSGEQFQQLYESMAYPNTQAVEELPVITGNVAVDERIRTIALSRGYKLRSVPIAPIMKVNEPGLVEDDLLQEKALAAWEELKEAAHAAGIHLIFSSGYRSIELQRAMFQQRLAAIGASYAQIIQGTADSAIVNILGTTAVPGYSRHHTGYTIDLRCGDGSGRAFEYTPCFVWMSANNYENAKKYGWIPSYPDGVDQQGPEPEPWEYVWVGKDAVRERPQHE